MENKSISLNIHADGKNMVIAYLLWWFLGWAGIHRFYLGKTGSGIAQLALTVIGWATAVILIGFVFLAIWGIWWLCDAYYVQKYVKEANQLAGLEGSTFTVSTQKQSSNNLEQLERLHTLYEKGVFTREEYEQKKSELM
jgi:TM2 domain-containing membrane protein YozV